ncbi:TPA: hypothetical protein ACX6QK_003356 [Photobacterium damselae]
MTNYNSISRNIFCYYSTSTNHAMLT